jgi:3-oxoacyl-[acyl-carrier protein] reductase
VTWLAFVLHAICLPLLRRASAPLVVFLSSVAARHGAPSATIYGASKGALDSLTRGLAAELAPDIKVNATAPGVIETPFHDKVSTPSG